MVLFPGSSCEGGSWIKELLSVSLLQKTPVNGLNLKRGENLPGKMGGVGRKPS
jgi:hypothetical protein